MWWTSGQFSNHISQKAYDPESGEDTLTGHCSAKQSGIGTAAGLQTQQRSILAETLWRMFHLVATQICQRSSGGERTEGLQGASGGLGAGKAMRQGACCHGHTSVRYRQKQGVWLSRSQCSLEAERVAAPEPGKVVTQSRVVTSFPNGGKPMRW